MNRRNWLGWLAAACGMGILVDGLAEESKASPATVVNTVSTSLILINHSYWVRFVFPDGQIADVPATRPETGPVISEEYRQFLKREIQQMEADLYKERSHR